MIRQNHASLCIYSEVLTVAEITRTLGISPSVAADIGEPTPAGRAGRPLKPEYLTHQRTFWTLECDESLIDPENENGFGSLRALMVALGGHAADLRGLRDQCDTIIRWWGDSDSSQGGFALAADLIAEIAATGCDLYGTTYLSESDDSAEG